MTGSATGKGLAFSYYDGDGLGMRDVVEAWGLGKHLGDVVKYILRAGKKGPVLPDLEKAEAYAARALELHDSHGAGALLLLAPACPCMSFDYVRDRFAICNCAAVEALHSVDLYRREIKRHYLLALIADLRAAQRIDMAVASAYAPGFGGLKS